MQAAMSKANLQTPKIVFLLEGLHVLICTVVSMAAEVLSLNSLYHIR